MLSKQLKDSNHSHSHNHRRQQTKQLANFVDETRHVVPSSPRKKRLRKPLKHAGLLQNYVEWSGNSNEMTTQFKINNEQKEEKEESYRYNQSGFEYNNNNNDCNRSRVGSSAGQHGCFHVQDKNSVVVEKNSLINCTVENFNNNELTHHNGDCNYNVILISEYFHLKLDVADFINSYNEMLTGTSVLPNCNISK